MSENLNSKTPTNIKMRMAIIMIASMTLWDSSDLVIDLVVAFKICKIRFAKVQGIVNEIN